MSPDDPSQSAKLLSRITPVNVALALVVGLCVGLIALLARRATSPDSSAIAVAANLTPSPTATPSRARATP
ncbi:MAG TPA: hypothetical protein VKQ72_01165, partial [Aggregatilineales bacterium]|nr:hypothetical protein [Aggregatilineales bacterium]